MDRSSWNGSSTAGITPWGTKSLKRAIAISRRVLRQSDLSLLQAL
jgi:hypothetical protein